MVEAASKLSILPDIISSNDEYQPKIEQRTQNWLLLQLVRVSTAGFAAAKPAIAAEKATMLTNDFIVLRRDRYKRL